MGVEGLQRIGQLVAAESQDGLVDDYDRDLGTLDGLVFRIVDRDVDGGFSSRRQFFYCGFRADLEGARVGRHLESDRSGGIGRAGGELFIRFAIGPEAARGAGQVDLDGDPGNHVVTNRDLDGVGSAFDSHPAGLDNAGAPQRDDGLGGGEGQLGENPRGISRPVLLAVGNQGDGFLFKAPVLGALFAGHPEGELALVLSSLCIGENSPQQVAAAGKCGEDRLCGLFAGGHLLAGDHLVFLQPLTFLLYPALADTEKLESFSSEDLAVDAGDYGVEAQRLAFIDKGRLAAQPDVDGRGVNQDGRVRTPALPVYIADTGAGGDGGGPWGSDRLEVDGEAVQAVIVGLAGEGFDSG